MYRGLYVAIAIALALGAATAAPDAGALALDRFAGTRILHDRSIPLHLGRETFTAVGAYNGGLGWLGALVVDALWLGGSTLAHLGSLLATFVTFAFVELRARRTAGRGVALAAVVLAAACAPGSLGIAGGIVTAAFAAALAYVLDRPGPRATLGATLLAVVWCNVAPQGLLAPAIAACVAAETTFKPLDRADRRAVAERRWARVACAGTLLATLATPAFVAYPALALKALRIDGPLFGVVEFHPVDVAMLAYRIGFTLVVVAAFGLGITRAGAIPLLVLGALLALLNGSYVVVFGALAAPLVAAAAANAWPKLATIATGSVRGDVLAGACALTLAVAFVWIFPRPQAVSGGYALAASLGADGRAHRLFCSEVDWCNAALAASPLERVFMDGRVAGYPPQIWNAQVDISRFRKSWRDRLEQFRIDAVLAPEDGPLAGLLVLAPGWHALASNETSALYVRDPIR